MLAQDENASVFLNENFSGDLKKTTGNSIPDERTLLPGNAVGISAMTELNHFSTYKDAQDAEPLEGRIMHDTANCTIQNFQIPNHEPLLSKYHAENLEPIPSPPQQLQESSHHTNLPLGFETDRDFMKYRSFIPSIFISAALPLRDVKKNVFDRKYNNITLHLNSPNMVPYGKYGRLLLSVLTTHAVQAKNNLNKDGTITINYTSLQELLDEMQLRKQRGMDVMEQLNRFKSATFIYEEENVIITQKSLFPEYFSPTDKGFIQAKKISTGNIMFIDSLQYIELDSTSSDKRSISFSIVLNNKFVDLCKKHSVPIDYTVYKEISSAMGKDLYAWIIYRNNSIGKDGIFIPRSNMVAQFSGTVQPDQERANFKYIIEQIQQIQSKYYPDLRFTVDKDYLGITFYKSPPIMLPKDTRYVLVTNT